jgi:hypothetical protein
VEMPESLLEWLVASLARVSTPMMDWSSWLEWNFNAIDRVEGVEKSLHGFQGQCCFARLPSDNGVIEI